MSQAWGYRGLSGKQDEDNLVSIVKTFYICIVIPQRSQMWTLVPQGQLILEFWAWLYTTWIAGGGHELQCTFRASGISLSILHFLTGSKAWVPDMCAPSRLREPPLPYSTSPLPGYSTIPKHISLQQTSPTCLSNTAPSTPYTIQPSKLWIFVVPCL